MNSNTGNRIERYTFIFILAMLMISAFIDPDFADIRLIEIFTFSLPLFVCATLISNRNKFARNIVSIAIVALIFNVFVTINTINFSNVILSLPFISPEMLFTLAKILPKIAIAYYMHIIYSLNKKMNVAEQQQRLIEYHSRLIGTITIIIFSFAIFILFITYARLSWLSCDKMMFTPASYFIFINILSNKQGVSKSESIILEILAYASAVTLLWLLCSLFLGFLTLGAIFVLQRIAVFIECQAMKKKNADNADQGYQP